MRRQLILTLLCGLLAWAPSAGAAYTLVVSTIAGNNTGGGDTVTTSTIDTSTADFIVLFVTTYSGAPTVSDSKSNTWTPLTSYWANTNNAQLAKFYYCVAPTVGSGHTFTFSNNAAPTQLSIAVLAFTGAKQTSPFDLEVGGGRFVFSTFQPGSTATTEANEIILSGFGTTDATTTPSIDDGSFTLAYAKKHNELGVNSSGLGLAYRITTSTVTVNPTWTSGSGILAGTNAVFKAAAGGGGSTGPPLKTLLGAGRASN